MIVVTRRGFKVPITVGAVGPVTVGRQTVAGVADFTNVKAPVFPFNVVPLLTNVAPVAPIEVGGHGRYQVKVSVVVQKINA